MSYASTVLADNPDFYYKLDEASGGFVNSSIHAHSIITPAVSAGALTYGIATPTGKGVEWTGSCWIVGHNPDSPMAGRSTTGPFSHEVVLMVPVAATNNHVLFGWGDPVFIGNGWYLILDVGVLGLLDHVGLTDFSASAINDAAFHHVVVTYDGTVWTCYLDGAALPTTLTHTITTGTSNIDLGGTEGSSAIYTCNQAVTMGDWAGYTAVLSQAQITAHYQAFLGIAPAGAPSVLQQLQPIVRGRFY